MKKWLDKYDKGGTTGKKLSQAEIANIRNFVANNADVNDINDPRYYMGRPPVNKSYNVTNRLSASNLPRYVDPNVKNDPSLKWVNAAAMLGPLAILAAPEIAAATATAAPYLTAPAVVAGTELAGVTPASIAAAYFAHEGYKKLPQTQASVVNAYRNPTTRNIINAANDVGWNTMDFLGLGEASKLAGEIANPISKLPGYYNKVATGESALPFAWKSPAVGLSQESSQAMFDKLLNSGQFTNEELKLIRQYQNNSNSFTGRNTPLDLINYKGRKQLNDIIKKYNLTGIDNAIATRRFNPDNNSIGATIKNNTINFGDRPTSFSTGIGLPNYGSGATNRIVIPNRYLSGMGDKFIANSYLDFPTISAERELIGTGLNFKRIGKVKNDIGGHDWIVKPINSTSEKELEWVKPSEQQLKQEFNIEHQLKNLNLFNNEDEFMNAVNNAKVEEVTTFDDKFIKNRSRANTKDQIIDYSKTYRSWPKYRNEQTIDNIYNGINSNGKMDMPIILEYPDGSRKMLSGNTRMDVSFQLGKNPKALIVKVPEQTTSLPQIQTVPREELPKYLYHGGPNIITDVNSIKRTREGLPIGNSATDENSVGFYAGPYTWFPREGAPNAFRETEGLYNRINMMGESAEKYAAGHPHGYIHEGELNPEANIVDWNTFKKLIQSDKFDFRRLTPKGAEIAENLGIHAIRDNSEYNILNPQKVFKSFKPAYKLKFGESWERFAKGGENINMGWLDRYADGGPNLEDMKANFLQQYRPSLQADNTRLGSQRANVTNDQAQQLQKDAIRNAQRAAEERARLANARQTMDNESIPFTFPTGEKKKWADMDSRERNYVRGQSLRTKGRINEEGKETLLDYVNPLNWYGNMAANAAEAPYTAKQTNSVMPYVMAAVEPLVAGRMMGSGTMNPFSKKFYTNSISDANFINNVGLGIPKVGIKLASRLPLENIPIVNQAYKYNPWRFTANPEAYYHRSPDLKNVVNKETGMLQGFGESEAGKLYNQSAMPGQGPEVIVSAGLPDEFVSRLNLKKAANNELYFSKGTPLDYGRTNMVLDKTTGKLVPGQGYQGPYIVEATNVPFVAKANGSFTKVFDNETGKFVRGKLPPTGIGKYAVSKRPISANEVNFYKENWLQGYRPVNVNTENSILPTLNANAILSNFENTKLGKALIGTNNLSTEFLGELLNGKKNRKGIKEGNEWLQNWIDHPATQAKIKNDMKEAVTPANRQEAFLNLIENQSRNYKVNTKEYSLLQQLKDNIAQYRDINAREPIHLDNSGVSYEHAESPFYRDYVEKGGKPNKRYGNWVSRAYFSNKANTTVHEGTHGWTSRNALEDSGLRNMSLENTNPEIKNDFYEWERLRNEGKSLKEIEKIMGKDRAFQAYIADPTEMHARTMELRKHFGIKPDEKFDVNDATKKLNKLSSLLKGNFKQPITGLKEYMNVIDNDPQKFANLLNKFWGVVPAGVTIGALNNSSGPANQYENGGYTTDYNFPAWQLADPIRASYHVVNPERFHGPDTYKYPNHMTFSNESMYSTPEHMGGTWTELKNGKWQFEPSQWNIQNAGGKKEFLKWWKQTEGKQGNKVKFDYGGSFGSAFAEARKDLGAGKIFTWNGKQYTTNYAEETNTVDNSAPVRRYTAPIRKQELVDNNADMAAIAEQRMQYYNQQRKAVPPIPYPVPVKANNIPANKSIVNNPFLNLAAPAQPQPFANLTPSYSNLTQFAYDPKKEEAIPVKKTDNKESNSFNARLFINGIKRNINKLFGDDESSATKLDLGKAKANVINKTAIGNKPIVPSEFENTYNVPRITGDTLWDDKDAGVYHMPMIVDLNQQSFGHRSRNDRTNVKSPGYLFGAIDDSQNFRHFVNAKTSQLNPDQFYSGVDPNTNKIRIQKGKWFQGKNIDVLPHQGFENVVGLAKDKKNKFVLKSAHGAANNYWTPQYIHSDNTVYGSPGLLMHKHQKDAGYYGNITGGNVVLTTPDFKRQIYVSGSVSDINNAIEQFKKTTGSKVINAVTVDNGSYARNYLKTNNNMSPEDWYNLDNRNTSGGLGYYMLPGKKDGGQIHNWREVEVPHKKNQLSGWLDKL